MLGRILKDIPEGFRKQSSNLNRDNGLTGVMPCRYSSHGMRSGTWRHFGSAFLSDQCTITCPQTQILYGGERKRTPLFRYAKAGRPQSMSGALAKSSSNRGDTHGGIIGEALSHGTKASGDKKPDVLADLPKWDSRSSILKETSLKPDIGIHSASTQKIKWTSKAVVSDLPDLMRDTEN